MIFFICFAIVTVIFLKELIAQTRKNLFEMKQKELLELKSQYSDWELHMVQIALPFRCLEFFFSSDKDNQNHVHSVYLPEQKSVLKEVLDKEYFITDGESIENFQLSVLVLLLVNYKVDKDVVSQTFLDYKFRTKPLTITESVAILTDILTHSTKQRKRDLAKLTLLDQQDYQYIEKLYIAHFYLLAYELGYIAKKDLHYIYDVHLQHVKTIADERSFLTFINWCKVTKTNAFILHHLTKKVRRTAFGKYGVLKEAFVPTGGQQQSQLSD